MSSDAIPTQIRDLSGLTIEQIQQLRHATPILDTPADVSPFQSYLAEDRPQGSALETCLRRFVAQNGMSVSPFDSYAA